MGTSNRRRRRVLSAAVAFAALVLGAMPSAYAQEDGFETRYPWIPDTDQFFGSVDGPITPQVFAEMKDCPRGDLFDFTNPGDGPDGTLFLCLKLKVYDGELQIGGTRASVDPIELTLAIARRGDEALFIPGPVEPRETPYTWEELAGGTTTADKSSTEADGTGFSFGFDPISISGGILGIPELDPLIDAEPLGLLSLAAAPRIGELGISDAVDFAFWLDGQEHDITITLPVSIQLNNLLLGDDCTINQFEINLTNATTSPPPGVQPISGSPGHHVQRTWWEDGWFFPGLGDQYALDVREQSRFVDNGFVVPGAANCGPLGLGPMLTDLGLNPLDMLVNSQAGLPGRAGSNYAAFSVDTLMSAYCTRNGVVYLGDCSDYYWTSFDEWLNGQ